MKLIMHGASLEVGRSCIELITDQQTRVLLDAGLKLGEHGSSFPVGVTNLSEIDAVFISHAHLDHTGALPLFDHQGLDCPIYCTAMTKAYMKILLEDSYKIGKLTHQDLGYFEEDIGKVLACIRNVKRKEEGTVQDITFSFYNAGHIPGSTSVLLEVKTKEADKGVMSVLYTGDINTQETELHHAASLEMGEVDVLITECTYGDREHPPRKQTHKKFLSMIKQTLSRGGSVIIPSFAVGRAQELLLILAQENWRVPVYLDGMAVKATRACLQYPKSVKDGKRLQRAFSRVKPVKNFKMRKKIMMKQGIFVTTSGMLTGGPVMAYLKHFHKDPKASIFLTGYQGIHTNGRMLLDHGHVYVDGWKLKVRCNLEQFDFSAHSGRKDLREMIRKLKPKIVVFNHGDEKAIEEMTQWCASLDITAHAPKQCESIPLTSRGGKEKGQRDHPVVQEGDRAVLGA
jgi:putative mRNA 3-end processing factor